MGRVVVVVLAVVGLLLAAAGLIVALAWGLPALGVNRLGRNPLDETVRALAFAATLYATGAAMLASATRWLRIRYGPLNLAAFGEGEGSHGFIEGVSAQTVNSERGKAPGERDDQ